MSLPPNFPKSTNNTQPRILAVCLGNICRSPTLEEVLRVYGQQHSLNLKVASCGTASYHEGEGAHPPTIHYGKKRGYDLSKHIARQLSVKDFEDYDLLLAADESNYRNIMKLVPPKHPEYAEKVKLAAEFLPANSRFAGARSIPDPWGGDKEDFFQVVDMCEDVASNLVELIKKHSQ